MRDDLYFVPVIHVTWSLESGLRAGGYINCVTPGTSTEDAVQRAFAWLSEYGYTCHAHEECFALNSKELVARLSGDMLEVMRQADAPGEPRLSSLFEYPSDDVPENL